MKLLIPGFELTDTQTSGSSPPNSQQANKCPSEDEQPCCSKDLMDSWREGGMTEDWEGEKSRPEEKKRKEDNKMEETKKEQAERMRSEAEERENETRKEEKEQQEEEVGSSAEEEGEEEETVGEDCFIRHSGLISHAYSLDLNLSPGRCSSHNLDTSTPTSYCVGCL